MLQNTNGLAVMGHEVSHAKAKHSERASALLNTGAIYI